ncbi:hypothetical protein PAECIP111893_00055 [Paenibacillus plantiphilus]|uniref:Uncharacterized protein n=1 Tax=Paenibacillus plantiphilus TaxID=2905650 RepID=A0ABM9BL89_9BACL|nr:hypothetical protein [Paenibacillus plantiphilus]CAH1189971.1 hypothetical protein PAECIP111893_00055 [Paenibacillus plantiphilus]
MTDPIDYIAPSRLRHRKAAEVIPFLEAYIAKKQQEIIEIEAMVERYEKRRMMEERAYQSMSAFRRLISGKKPDHHLAVEYIHYVKKPMEKARVLRMEVENARTILSSSNSSDTIAVTGDIADAMI